MMIIIIFRGSYLFLSYLYLSDKIR